MSVNFVESVVDKLLSPSRGSNEISLPRKFSGSQNLLGTDSKMNQNIVSEFHQFLDSDRFAPSSLALKLSSSVAKLNYFDSSNHSLLSGVPKLFSPSFSNLNDSLGFLSNQAELLFESVSYLNLLTSDIYQTFNQPLLLNTQDFNCEDPPWPTPKSQDFNCKDPQLLTPKTQGFNCESPLLTPKLQDINCVGPQLTPKKKMPCDFISVSTAVAACAKPALVTAQDAALKPPSEDAVLLKSDKHMVDCFETLNHEMVNRKTKELNKRSKKRRRRQKKNNLVNNKIGTCSMENSERPAPNKESTVASHPSQVTSSECLNVNRDILCDIVSIAGQANGVQILLPELPSFVISLESASSDDDAEWETCSDTDWLTECAEFELTGLFISNLSVPISSTCPIRGLVSHLDVPDATQNESKELRKLQNELRRVNRSWNEATKEIDRKPKRKSKVSFAPDDELIEIFQVEIYNRKGEWEVYARERMRFKKRINELDSVISPCLSKEHRAKIFLRLHQTNL